MRTRKQPGLVGGLLLSLAFTATACSGSGDDQIPTVVCGTRVDRDLTRPLLTSTEDLHESSRVDRSEAISAPCTLLSDGRPILELFFYWTSDAPKLAGRSEYDSVFEDVSQGRPVDLADEAIVGTNGAIVSTPCKTDRSAHFTLKLHLHEAKITDEGRRKDIEKFMRAYFPATVKTLSCR
ncbi:hypothetical protein [Streptomyces sp. NPDC052610]|uniref:hypothetical protein n=1 Tax=Streptomyces sp. NPDC052610 TaxID=3154952 RepID=UPI00342EDFFF